ncbi:hypothetical protein E2C01_021041 [Portunus trituberculatus]|uniref:Uncharacterized protein n=1 Tax=Portunus trituberculatus TaxID=210409 RepID=A0A5B7E3L8_PORTR|nr:hypothetical protein [Portunus trituberculatus]
MVGFEPTRGRLSDPTLSTLSTTPPSVVVMRHDHRDVHPNVHPDTHPIRTRRVRKKGLNIAGSAPRLTRLRLEPCDLSRVHFVIIDSLVHTELMEAFLVCCR